jgi:predicted nucleic acid-binding protein
VKDYADTSFVLSLYLLGVHSPKAAAHVATRKLPLAVSALLAFEVEQAIRHAAFRKARPLADVQKALTDWQEDLANGVVEIENVDWPTALEHARRISRARTLADGYRSLDILHVATALALHVDEFLSFDIHQRKLAATEGLTVKP